MKKYKTDFSDEELKNALHKNDNRAKELIENPSKWAEFKGKFYDFLEKAKNIPVLGAVIDDVITMVELVDAYINEGYREIPVPSIISIVAAVIYVVSPIDIIPDWIPVVGYVDDVAVVMFVLHLGVDKDLDVFRKWKQTKISERLKQVEEFIFKELQDELNNRKLVAVVMTDDEKLKLLHAEPNELTNPIECKISILNIPTSILKQYSIDTRNTIIGFFQNVFEHHEEIWLAGAEHKVYFEPDFDDMWDSFVILEE